MFYPPQISFIPVTVALTKFIDVNGFLGNFPYWYLGTTPTKYLIGPVVPAILIGLKKLLPGFSLFDLSYILLYISYFLFSFGWGMFSAKLSGSRKVGIVVGILSLFLPWRFFSTMAFGEVSAVLAGALTPWILLIFESTLVLTRSKNARLNSFLDSIFNIRLAQDSVGNKSFNSIRMFMNCTADFIMFLIRAKPIVLSILIFVLLLLVNSTAVIPGVIGIFILAIVVSGKWEQGVKLAGLVVFAAWFLTLFWYGFGYWVTVFFKTPSVGGRSVPGAIVSLLNSLRVFLPVTLAIVIVRFGFKPKNVYEKFVFSWLGVFVCITFFRFVSDPDFWMDWTSWISEIEVGVVLLVAGPVSRFLPASALSSSKRSSVKSELFTLDARTLSKNLVELRAVGSPSTTATRSKLNILLTLFSIYFLVGWFLVWKNSQLWMPRKSIENSAEYRVAKELEVIVGLDQTVFLSGSTAFWLNSLSDVAQVRGGRDEVAQNTKWREVNWQLTQGVKINDAVASLKELGVDFIVVHGNSSSEYYHDFKNAEIFDHLGTFEKVYDYSGDKVYKVR